MQNGLRVLLIIVLILSILIFCFGGTYILFNSNPAQLDNYMYYDLADYELTSTYSTIVFNANIDNYSHIFVIRNYRRFNLPSSPIFEGISNFNYSTGSIVGEFILPRNINTDYKFAEYVYNQPNHTLKADNIYIAPQGLIDILVDNNLETPSILEYKNEFIKASGIFNANGSLNGDTFSFSSLTNDLRYPFDFNTLGRALSMVTILTEYGRPVLADNADLLGVIKYTFVDYPQYVIRLIDGYLSFFLGKIL